MRRRRGVLAVLVEREAAAFAGQDGGLLALGPGMQVDRGRRGQKGRV